LSRKLLLTKGGAEPPDRFFLRQGRCRSETDIGKSSSSENTWSGMQLG